MITKTLEGLKHLQITPEGKMVLIIGTTGQGKSVLLDNYAYQFRRKFKGKVIYISEKMASPMENAFMCMDKIPEKIIKLLDDIGLDEFHRVPEKVQILHPIDAKFPKYNVPENISLYSFPIKEVDDYSYGALIGRSMQSPATLMISKIKKKLTDEDNIYTFLNKIYKLSTDSDEEEVRFNTNAMKDNMGVPIESYGSKKDLQQITTSFSKLQQFYMLHKQTSETNIDEQKWKEIIQDTETITMFTKGQIKDENMRYFIDIELSKKLYEYLPKYAKHPTLLIFEEIKGLFSKTAPEGSIQKELVDVLSKMMDELRVIGVTILLSSQSYSQTNSKLRASIDDKNQLFMGVSPTDKKSLKRDFNMNTSNFNQLNNLRKGQFMVMRELISSNSYAYVYNVPYVPFGHREHGDGDFIQEFRKRYKDKCVSKKEQINKILKDRDSDYSQLVDNLKEEHQSKKEKKNKKETPPEPQPTDEKQELQQTPKKEVINETELAEKCYAFILTNPESSWRGREGILEVTRGKMQKIVLQYALNRQDFSFIRQHFSKDYVKKHHWEYYNEVYN